MLPLRTDELTLCQSVAGQHAHRHGGRTAEHSKPQAEVYKGDYSANINFLRDIVRACDRVPEEAFFPRLSPAGSPASLPARHPERKSDFGKCSYAHSGSCFTR